MIFYDASIEQEKETVAPSEAKYLKKLPGRLRAFVTVYNEITDPSSSKFFHAMELIEVSVQGFSLLSNASETDAVFVVCHCAIFSLNICALPAVLLASGQSLLLAALVTEIAIDKL